MTGRRAAHFSAVTARDAGCSRHWSLSLTSEAPDWAADRARPAPARPRYRQRRAHDRVPRHPHLAVRSWRSCSRWPSSARRRRQRSAWSATLVDMAVLTPRRGTKRLTNLAVVGDVPRRRRHCSSTCWSGEPDPGRGERAAASPRSSSLVFMITNLLNFVDGRRARLRPSGRSRFCEQLPLRLPHGAARRVRHRRCSPPASRSATSASVSEPSGLAAVVLFVFQYLLTGRRPGVRARRAAPAADAGARLAPGRAHQHRACRPCRCGTR